MCTGIYCALAPLRGSVIFTFLVNIFPENRDHYKPAKQLKILPETQHLFKVRMTYSFAV